ncbi:hypothetical protein C8Q79DRAFT_984404 [Trametes meyenii]|nr:hypothetical protein C8Q79DRAFT_984404 [Trametes meyenii]
MPPRKRTDAADVETKAKLSHPSKPLIWLELSKAIGTMADPAPWSYEDFVSSLKLTKPIVPAYKPDAPPRECGVSIKEKGQIDAFVCEFNSASNPRGVFTSARSRQNHNYPGYRALSKWFDKTTAQIKLNLRFEEMYAANGVTVASHAQADMSGLMPQDECIWILQSIRKEWFGKHISPQTAEAQKIKAASLTFLKGLQSLTFNRWRGFLGRERRKIEEAEDEIRGYEALAQGGSIGPEDAVAYISALKKTLELVAVWKDGPLRERYEQLEMTTEVVLADLAGDVPPAFSALDLPKALRDALKNLPSPKMAERLRETLLEAMRTVQSTGEAITLGEHDHTDWKSGVEAYEHLRVPDIVSALGLPNEQLPFFLDKIDMVGSEDAWSEQGQRALKGPNASALKPFWHQWVGILKMIDNMFEGRSTLLLDGVGIGKTLQVIGFLAMYEWLYLQGDHCSARFKEMAKGHEKLPRVPHVLVVPCNRTPQWTDELHRYIKMGTIAILPYNHSCNLGARQAFWKAFDAIPEQIPIIILTTYTTLRSDAMTIYNLSCQWLLGGDDYSQVKPMGGVDPKLVSSTLLGSGRHFGIVAFDEIHTARKLGPVHFACSRLVDIAHAAVGLTGTPIITGPIDLVMIARILKIEGFSVEEVDGYRKGFNRLKAQENRSKVAKMKARQDAKAAALGKVPSQAASSGPSGETTSKQLAKNWLDEAREKAALHIVRRDRDSLDCDGKAISTLYPLTQTYIVVKLRKDEMAVQRQLANAIGKNNPFANDKNTSAFYNGLRQSLLHKSAADEQWARRNAQAFQYKDDPSTKIDVLVKILNFIKGKSCVPPIEYINGEIRVKSQVPPDWPRPEGSGPDKVVVFLAFPKSNWIVEKVRVRLRSAALLQSTIVYRRWMRRASLTSPSIVAVPRQNAPPSSVTFDRATRRSSSCRR